MSDPGGFVVADTSIMINLNATERAADILSNLPFRVVVTDIVAAELFENRRSGRRDAELLAALVQAGHAAVVSLGDTGLTVFGELVIGSAQATLDDGEASTIAYAVEHDLVPVIDERKALRICGARFSSLRPRSTIDLLAGATVLKSLGRDALGDAVFRALQNARMPAAAERIASVIDLIGVDRAALCASLPRSARRPGSNPTG